MSYAVIEASAAEGRTYHLYQFVAGAQIWLFTSRTEDWISAGSGAADLVWQTPAISHDNVVQTSEIERRRLELTFPLSHSFARRFLAPHGNQSVTLAVFRDHD
jgi:hypothetical protein